MPTSPANRTAVLNGFLLGAGGFSLGGLAALLLLAAFNWLNLGQRLADWLPDEQYLARLLTRLLLLLAFLAIAGGVSGVIGGLFLSRVDPGAPPRRYIWAGAITYALSGFLLAGFLLLTALFGAVNNADDLSLGRFLAQFGVYGFIFGLILGGLFGLMTVGARYFWRPWLAAILGYTAGGVLVGLLLWIASTQFDQGLPFNGLLLAALGFLAVFGLGGGALCSVYAWIARQRTLDQRVPGRLSPFWTTVGLAVLVVVVYGAYRVGTKLYSFVTIKEGTLSSQIGLETTGVAWSQPPAELPADGGIQAGSLQMAGGSQGQVAAVWADSSGEVRLSEGQYDPLSMQTTWGAPVNVSGTAGPQSSLPQIAALPQGGWLVTWQEETAGDAPLPSAIWLAECQAGACRPPVSLSGDSMPACATGTRHEAPVVAANSDGSRMAAWLTDRGDLIYSTWGAAEAPPAAPNGCGPAGGGEAPLSLVSGRSGQFSLAYRSLVGTTILAANYAAGGWQAPQPAGQGSDPVLLRDAGGRVHLAWCSSEQEATYRRADGITHTAQTPQFPACSGQPALVEDSQLRVHLLWYASQVHNNFGKPVAGDFLVESIDQIDGLTPAGIAARLEQPAAPAAANDALGTLFLAWSDSPGGQPAIYQSVQPEYQCSDPPATAIGIAVLKAMESGDYRPPGTPIPYCGNRFERLLFAPEPPPGLAIPPSPNGAYDTIAEFVESTRYEVVFTTMEYQPDANDDSPGFLLAEAIVDLYEKLKANPEDYPRGLTVRILLGNYPNLTTLEFGDQIYHVLEDLYEAGLPALTDPAIGWKVEVANFDGQYPHGHTKFIVIDGKTAAAVGFNYSYLHYFKDHPSGKGDGLVDLGMQVSGPAAQAVLAVFDDLWQGSNQIQCNTLDPLLDTWQFACNWTIAQATHAPEVLKYYLPGENSNATVLALFRSAAYKEADEAVVTAIRSASTSLDFFEVNFSLEIQCMLNMIDPSLCNIEQALDYMNAILDALEENPVKVRVLFTDVNSNGLENFIATDVFRQELEKRGLSEWVEIRYWPERMHSKAILIDNQLLIIGSQNMHYSSFGERGLTEFSLATESPEAIEAFQLTFEFYWERSLPVEEGAKPTTQ